MNRSNKSSAIHRRHWVAAAMLAVVTCGVSFGEEAKVEKNDMKFLALCKDPNATPQAIEALIKAGANANAKDKEGKTALDHAKDNKKIYKTKVYWKLNDLQYE